ncbi:MAG: hypothetical protein L0216_16775, partial [Planctomycetales bacterium]|nr:hypothetical protein [Planctomycetales bacterium]
MSRASALAGCLALAAASAGAQSPPAADGAGLPSAKSAPLPKAKQKEFAEALGWWLLMAEDPGLASSKKRDEKLEKLKKLEACSWKGARAAFNGWSPHPRGMPKQDMTHKLEYKFNPAVFTQNRSCFGVPSRYQPGRPTPVVLALHGGVKRG